MIHHWITEKLGICTDLTAADALRDDKDFTRVIDLGYEPIHSLNIHPECLYSFFSIKTRQDWIRKPVRHGLTLLCRGYQTTLLINSRDMDLSARIAYTILRALGIEKDVVITMIRRCLPDFQEPDRIERLLNLFGLSFGHTANRRAPGRFRQLVHPGENKYRLDFAKSLLCQKRQNSRVIQTVQKQFKLEIWEAQRLVRNAKDSLKKDQVESEGLSPEEFNKKELNDAVNFWREIAGGDYSARERMAAQQRLEELFKLLPKDREADTENRAPQVVFYIPENNRLSKRKKELAIPVSNVIVDGETITVEPAKEPVQ